MSASDWGTGTAKLFILYYGDSVAEWVSIKLSICEAQFKPHTSNPNMALEKSCQELIIFSHRSDFFCLKKEG